MPLLPAEPVVHPSTLFADPTPGVRRWWVFQTRPRAEKSFARLLLKADTAYFLPTFTRVWRKGGRTFWAVLPLFSGYVFVAGEPQVRETAFKTQLVVRECVVPDQDLLDRELTSVYHLHGGGDSLRPEDHLVTGAPVLIVEGTYAGVRGRVLEVDEGLRVCVEVSLLGRGVSVPIERWMIQPLEAA